MQFSSSSEHALRALLAIVGRGTDRPVQGRELASAARIPAPYLSKILGTLARAGVVTAVRGVNGGYRLARDGSKISLLEVVDLFEGTGARQACLLDSRRKCGATTPCGAHQSWRRVHGRWLTFLQDTTLADVAPKRTKPSRRGRRR